MKRTLTIALVSLLMLTTLTPVAVTGDTTFEAGAATDPGPEPLFQENTSTDDGANTGNDSANNSTDENNIERHPDAPDAAEIVRLTPVDYDEDYLGIETTEADSEYRTRGPFATFTSSESIDAVRIQQSAAEATLLDGERSVLVEYEDDAAPSENESYFALELYFDDGSTTTIDLYATETDVSVEAAKLSEYQGFIEYVEGQAEGEGFETSPDGAQEYVEHKEERAELLDNLLSERAAELLGLAMAAAMNPLAWILVLGTIAILAYRRESHLGEFLETIENDAGEAQRKERELIQAYERQAMTADEEPLTSLDAIGPQQAAYWKDTFGVTSVRQLAELAQRGRQVRADGGNLEHPHAGVDDLHAEELRDSWLEPILRSHRLSTPREALSHMRSAVVRMHSKYGMGHRYRETRSRIEELLAETEPEGAAGGGR